MRIWRRDGEEAARNTMNPCNSFQSTLSIERDTHGLMGWGWEIYGLEREGEGEEGGKERAGKKSVKILFSGPRTCVCVYERERDGQKERALRECVCAVSFASSSACCMRMHVSSSPVLGYAFLRKMRFLTFFEA
jgi:hypothetical protein